MTVFETLMSEAHGVLNESLGATVTLKRGPSASSSFTARRKQQQSGSVATSLETTQRMTFREYWLPQSSCVIHGITVEPIPGDYIVEGSQKWQIDAFRDGEKAVENVRGLEWKCLTRLVSGG